MSRNRPDRREARREKALEMARVRGDEVSGAAKPVEATAEVVLELMTRPLEKGELLQYRERKIKDLQERLSPSEKKRLADMVHTIEKNNRALAEMIQSAR